MFGYFIIEQLKKLLFYYLPSIIGNKNKVDYNKQPYWKKSG